MLQYLLESLERARLGRLVVATSDSPADDGIAALAADLALPCVRGDEADVASRFAAAVERYGFEAFARVCGDSPLLDPELIRRGLAEFAASPCDLATNTHPRSFPKGQSVEVVRSEAFLRARPGFDAAGDREHVTRYFYRNAERFRIRNFASGGDWSAVQLSVDLPEDFRRLETLLARAEKPHWDYRWSDWVSLLDAERRAGEASP
jgi:spore coat polysaccharide biosynthesis protein SpsF